MKMNDDEFPLAYLLTWTTYGTWLPGDQRGWVKKGSAVVQAPDPNVHEIARRLMTQKAVVLSQEQRDLVDSVIVKHCEIRKWILHARNVRTNHIHVVVSAALDGAEIRSQLKAWSSRRLSEQAGASNDDVNGPRRWWTEKGDIKWIDHEDHLHNAIRYVNDLQ